MMDWARRPYFSPTTEQGEQLAKEIGTVSLLLFLWAEFSATRMASWNRFFMPPASSPHTPGCQSFWVLGISSSLSSLSLVLPSFSFSRSCVRYFSRSSDSCVVSQK
jgi:hypothetical protein